MASLLSLRARLAMFALVCAVPVLALTALQLRSDANLVHAAAQAATTSLAETARNRIEQDLASAQLLAVGLGAMVRKGADPECGDTLPSVLSAAGPRVTNVILVSADGWVQCSARPLAGARINVSDRPHMRRALELRRPVLSEFVVGRISGQPNLQLVVPILDGAGPVAAFVVVGLTAPDLLAGIAMDASLQPSLALFDARGVLVSHSQPAGTGIRPGELLVHHELFARRQDASRQPIELTGLDGERRLSVARPVRLRQEPVGWVVSGAALGELQGAARAALHRDLSMVALLAMVVVLLAVLGARPLVLSRYRQVLAVASQMAAGQHGTRVPIRIADDLAPVERAINHMLDALERDAAQRAESESRYRLLFEHNMDAVLETLPDGRVLKGNAAACALLQRDAATLATLTREALVDLSDERLPGLLQERDATGRARGGLRFRRADGTTFEAEVTSSVYEDLHGQRVTCMVFRDITDSLQAQARILELNAQLEERVRQRTRELEQSNSELQAFTSSVSHDLRSPVATIQAFSQQLQERDLVTDPKGRHYVERISVAARRMGALIEGLLALSQINRARLHLTALDISGLANECVQECRDADQERREVDVQVEGGMTAHGDARLVHAVLSNLIRNAWKFSSRQPAPAIRVASAGTDADGAPVFCVQDNGVGFDEAHAGHLFEAFHRLHRDDEFPGLGIGLATVQRIVARHGGRVWARSTPGQGASFFFSLPLASA